jgi:hypothetical protein
MIRSLMIFLLVTTFFASRATAGPFSKRPNKPEPAEYVPVLIKTLQGDPDERKREIAAGELRDYDMKQFPDIMPTLIEALKNDPNSSVRHEVVNSIGKLRPISEPAGFALDQAATNDSSFRVRAAAKSTLFQWIWLGYSPRRAQHGMPNQTEEPPLAQPLAPITPNIVPKTSQVPAATLPYQAPEPIRPIPPYIPTSGKPSNRPFFPLFPWKKSESRSPDEGPALNPPK